MWILKWNKLKEILDFPKHYPNCYPIKSRWCMREVGMGKIRICCNCGKCLELI